MLLADTAKLSLCVRKPTIWVLTRSDTNWAIQSQKQARNFGFKKKRKCTIHIAKTKALISFAVTAKLICVFVFAYADCWFSHAAAQLCESARDLKQLIHENVLL